MTLSLFNKKPKQEKIEDKKTVHIHDVFDFDESIDIFSSFEPETAESKIIKPKIVRIETNGRKRRKQT